MAPARERPGERQSWLRTLASLDSLPVGYRSDLGCLLLDALATVTEAQPGTTVWRMRTFGAGPDHDQLGFAVCSALTDRTPAPRSPHGSGYATTNPARAQTSHISRRWVYCSRHVPTGTGTPPCTPERKHLDTAGRRLLLYDPFSLDVLVEGLLPVEPGSFFTAGVR